jgi:hypothetical protein
MNTMEKNVIRNMLYDQNDDLERIIFRHNGEVIGLLIAPRGTPGNSVDKIFFGWDSELLKEAEYEGYDVHNTRFIK